MAGWPKSALGQGVASSSLWLPKGGSDHEKCDLIDGADPRFGLNSHRGNIPSQDPLPRPWHKTLTRELCTERHVRECRSPERCFRSRSLTARGGTLVPKTGPSADLRSEQTKVPGT